MPDRIDILLRKCDKIMYHLEDIAEGMDQITLANMTLYNNQVEIARKLNIKLPEPLINMNLEEENLHKKRTFEGSVILDGTLIEAKEDETNERI